MAQWKFGLSPCSLLLPTWAPAPVVATRGICWGGRGGHLGSVHISHSSWCQLGTGRSKGRSQGPAPNSLSPSPAPTFCPHLTPLLSLLQNQCLRDRQLLADLGRMYVNAFRGAGETVSISRPLDFSKWQGAEHPQKETEAWDQEGRTT